MLRSLVSLSVFCLLLWTGLGLVALLAMALAALGMPSLIYPVFGLGMLINFAFSSVLAVRLVQRSRRGGPA